MESVADRISCATLAALARADAAAAHATLARTMFAQPPSCSVTLDRQPFPTGSTCAPPPPPPFDPAPWTLAPGAPARFLEATRPRGEGAFF